MHTYRDFRDVVDHVNRTDEGGAMPPDNDPHPVIPWLTAPRRRWLYGILTAANPLLIVSGIASESTAPLWVALAVAAAHTPTSA